jgi:hypothetical protein
MKTDSQRQRIGVGLGRWKQDGVLPLRIDLVDKEKR